MIGGYKIIDFKDTDFATGTAKKVSGVYHNIEGSYRAAIMLSGLTIDSVEQPNRFVVFTHSNSTFYAWIGRNEDGADIGISVTDQDMVTVTKTEKTA